MGYVLEWRLRSCGDSRGDVTILHQSYRPGTPGLFLVTTSCGQRVGMEVGDANPSFLTQKSMEEQIMFSKLISFYYAVLLSDA